MTTHNIKNEYSTFQMQTESGRREGKYKGPIDVIKKTYREGGIRSVFRGTLVTGLRG